MTLQTLKIGGRQFVLRSKRDFQNYAKHAGLKRTELCTQALRHFLPTRNAS
jgi:hypothetical protein